MQIEQHLLLIPTEGRGAKDITSEITRVLKPINIRTGMCNLFLQHPFNLKTTENEKDHSAS